MTINKKILHLFYTYLTSSLSPIIDISIKVQDHIITNSKFEGKMSKMINSGCGENFSFLKENVVVTCR